VTSSDPPHWPCDTSYPQKLALISPTSGGRSVGVVRSRTKATELVSSDLIGNRTRDLTTCSIVPQATTLPPCRLMFLYTIFALVIELEHFVSCVCLAPKFRSMDKSTYVCHPQRIRGKQITARSVMLLYADECVPCSVFFPTEHIRNFLQIVSLLFASTNLPIKIKMVNLLPPSYGNIGTQMLRLSSGTFA
jgi:hypothetical protein